MKVHKHALGIIETNCYYVEGVAEVLIIDPGAEAERIISDVVALNKKVAAVLLTHTHFDHIGAVDEVAAYFKCDVYLAKEEQYWLTDPEANGSSRFLSYGIESIVINHQPKLIQPGRQSIGEFNFKVIHTPGHSPGSLSFYFDDFAIVGDTLFHEGIGRTDLKDGNMQTLIHSITEKLFNLPEETMIYPGHGKKTTIGYEMDHNPFINGY